MENTGKRTAMLEEIEGMLTEMEPAELQFMVAFAELMQEKGADDVVRFLCNVADALRANAI